MIKGKSEYLHIICLLLAPDSISQCHITMEGKIVDCDWGKNGEDEPALWDDWMMGDNQNDLEEVPVGLFEDWVQENAMNAVAGGNQNDSQEVPVELFDDWDLEDGMRAGTVRPKKDNQSKTKIAVPSFGCKEASSAKDHMNDEEDDDKSGRGAVLADQHNMSGEEKNSPEDRVVGLPRMKQVIHILSPPDCNY